MANTIRRDAAPRRRNLGPTARLTKDAIDRLNDQREAEVIPLARGTRETLRQRKVGNGSDSHPRIEPPQAAFVDEPEIAIEAAPMQEPESRQTSTIQGMPPIDKAPAKPAPRRYPGDSQGLVYALVALVVASALFAFWAMTR